MPDTPNIVCNVPSLLIMTHEFPRAQSSITAWIWYGVFTDILIYFMTFYVTNILSFSWCRNRKDFCNNWAFDSVFVQYWAQYVALAPARPDNPVTKKVYREPDGSYTQAPTTVLPVTSTEQPDDQDILTVTGKYTLGTFYKALDAERGKTAVSVTTNAPTGSPTIKSSSERRTAALLFLVLACFLSLLGWLE